MCSNRTSSGVRSSPLRLRTKAPLSQSSRQTSFQPCPRSMTVEGRRPYNCAAMGATSSVGKSVTATSHLSASRSPGHRITISAGQAATNVCSFFVTGGCYLPVMDGFDFDHASDEDLIDAMDQLGAVDNFLL